MLQLTREVFNQPEFSKVDDDDVTRVFFHPGPDLVQDVFDFVEALVPVDRHQAIAPRQGCTVTVKQLLKGCLRVVLLQ